MPESRLGDYCRHIDHLKQKYKNRIQIYKGMEVDFIPRIMGPNHPSVKKAGLDYTIGSIHFIDAFDNGIPWEADGNHWKFATGLLEIFDGDIQNAVTRYYELTRQMLETDCPDILGHLDKIKIQNHFFKYFSEQETWYRDEVKKTVDVIADSKVIVEVNTRGLYKQKTSTPYPSPWILKQMKEKNIPVMINSDSHRPQEIVAAFNEAALCLLEVGYSTVKVLYDGEWQDQSLEDLRQSLPVAV
jgi:histidinol-phosphatase (PHP family)